MNEGQNLPFFVRRGGQWMSRSKNQRRKARLLANPLGDLPLLIGIVARGEANSLDSIN